MAKMQSFAPGDYRHYLRSLAQTGRLHRLSRHLDPSDAVQEALLYAHEKRDQFRGTKEHEYRAWLRRILTNVVGTAARRHAAKKRKQDIQYSGQMRIAESLLPDLQPTPSSIAVRHESSDQLFRALRRLSEDHQQAIRLRYLSGLSLKEVAFAIEKSETATAGLLRRGAAALRNLMQEPGAS